MVSFSDAIKNFYLKAFTFKGRATRAEFWWIRLYQLLVFLFAFICMCYSVEAGGIISVIFILVNIIPDISLQVRRFHDIGKSGTTLLTILGVSMICSIAVEIQIPIISGLFALGQLIVSICQFIMNVTHGEKKDNEYGPNPYAISEDCIVELNGADAVNTTAHKNNNLEDVEL